MAEVKKGPQIGAGRGIKITAKPGGGDVGGSSSYKISNREATRDMDWLCAISSMEGLLCIYVRMSYLSLSLSLSLSMYIYIYI